MSNMHSKEAFQPKLDTCDMSLVVDLTPEELSARAKLVDRFVTLSLADHTTAAPRQCLWIDANLLEQYMSHMSRSHLESDRTTHGEKDTLSCEDWIEQQLRLMRKNANPSPSGQGSGVSVQTTVTLYGRKRHSDDDEIALTDSTSEMAEVTVHRRRIVRLERGEDGVLCKKRVSIIHATDAQLQNTRLARRTPKNQGKSHQRTEGQKQDTPPGIPCMKKLRTVSIRSYESRSIDDGNYNYSGTNSSSSSSSSSNIDNINSSPTAECGHRPNVKRRKWYPRNTNANATQPQKSGGRQTAIRRGERFPANTLANLAYIRAKYDMCTS